MMARGAGHDCHGMAGTLGPQEAPSFGLLFTLVLLISSCSHNATSPPPLCLLHLLASPLPLLRGALVRTAAHTAALPPVWAQAARVLVGLYLDAHRRPLGGSDRRCACIRQLQAACPGPPFCPRAHEHGVGLSRPQRGGEREEHSEPGPCPGERRSAGAPCSCSSCRAPRKVEGGPFLGKPGVEAICITNKKPLLEGFAAEFLKIGAF